ncbi:MAG: methyltransferase [Xanthomonadales bacterium]|nr:methyltransferase [Xanthomonadales bacterium]NIN58486.1 methyltransferase [Xanthomonadales bacterium]NIN76038.1 methyltransferase [Xanthomonadales bacterium]NIO13674.1 methyltransferase [Xanthomonadales bacterium]NIP10879.1 methyltransferase [Xanthomonadales bacterium]
MSKFIASVLALAGITAPPLAADEPGGAPDHLAAVLAAQPEAVQARYAYRHPQETLTFFGIEPGMTVVEALPGGGWYSKILLAYLGPDGTLIGADYAADMFPLFGFFSPEQLEARKTWVADWPAQAVGWEVPDSAQITAFQFGSLPEALKGTADAVVMIRALHNLARFEGQGGYLTAAMQDVFDVLKPGGILGVVQHMARDEMPDEWASGARGYLKDDFVIERFTAAGFQFTGMSGINFNDRDQPGVEDVVWRLPPTLATSRENPELRAAMEAIGESNRMTITFRKPE